MFDHVGLLCNGPLRHVGVALHLVFRRRQIINRPSQLKARPDLILLKARPDLILRVGTWNASRL